MYYCCYFKPKHIMDYKILSKEDIPNIIPLIKELNSKTPIDILSVRFSEMFEMENYECVGLFNKKELIAICGLWYSIRHYIGKSVEIDHFIIDKNYRNKMIGTKMLNWIEERSTKKGFEAIELNTYTENKESHRFYSKELYDIFGFHYIKIIRNDKKFIDLLIYIPYLMCLKR